MKKVFIIVLNYNGDKFVISCLKSITEVLFKAKNISLVVVDNASTDNSVSLIKKTFPKLKIIENQENLGFAEGNNIGIRYALNNNADCIVLLNNDTLVDKDLIFGLIKTFTTDKKIGVVSPKIYFAPGREFHYERYKPLERGKVIWYAGGKMDWKNVLGSHRGVDEVDRGQYDKIEETDFATGCCLAVKREVFKRIGLLDKKYFLYYEDADFCQRTKLAGYKVVYTPLAKIWHLNAGTTGGSGSRIHQYYQTRNRLLFAWRYAKLKTKILVFKEAIKLLFSQESVKKEAVKDFFLGRMGKRK